MENAKRLEATILSLLGGKAKAKPLSETNLGPLRHFRRVGRAERLSKATKANGPMAMAQDNRKIRQFIGHRPEWLASMKTKNCQSPSVIEHQ